MYYRRIRYQHNIWIDVSSSQIWDEFVAVVVLTLTHNTMPSVVAGQAPITLEWKKYLGSKTEANTKNKHTYCTTADTREERLQNIFSM